MRGLRRDGQAGRCDRVDGDVVGEVELGQAVEDPASEVVVADRADQPRGDADLGERKRGVRARPADAQAHLVDERARPGGRKRIDRRQHQVDLDAADDRHGMHVRVPLRLLRPIY
jgi:hypothetical protein